MTGGEVKAGLMSDDSGHDPAGTVSGAHALRELVLPVVVVAASEPGATSCATTTTSYISLSPPMLAVALRPASRTAQMVTRTGRFSLSMLAASQADVAQRAGRVTAGPDKIASLGLVAEPAPDGAGPPGIAGPGAVLWCTVATVTEVGDHLVITGLVDRCRTAADGTPLLLRHKRRYLATGQPLTGAAPDGYPI